MIIPNKTIRLDESALGLSMHVLDYSSEPVHISTLWADLQSKYPSIDQFLFALDVLYVLKKIDIDDGLVTYAC